MNLRHPFLAWSMVALFIAASPPAFSAEPAAKPQETNVLGTQLAEELITRLEAQKWRIPKPVRAAIAAQCCRRLAASEAAVRRQTCVYHPLSYVAAASRLEVPLTQEELAKLLEPKLGDDGIPLRGLCLPVFLRASLMKRQDRGSARKRERHRNGAARHNQFRDCAASENHPGWKSAGKNDAQSQRQRFDRRLHAKK